MSIEILSTMFFGIAQYIDWNNNRTNITFRCVFPHSCGALIGGCIVTMTSQTAGIVFNHTEEVTGGGNVVEVSFNNVNFSEAYNYSANFMRQDLVTPIGGSFNGIIPAMIFDNSSNIHPSQSVMHAISKSSAVSVATSLPGTRSTSTIIKPMQSTPTGSLTERLSACLSNCTI